MIKEFSLEKLVRPNIRKLKPYRSARENYQQGLLLDANENSRAAPDESLKGLHRYPSPQQKKLRQKIADFRNVELAHVFVGNGSDEAIDLLYRIFCCPGRDRVITTPPTYGMYGVAAGIHDIAVDKVPLDEQFQPDVKQILDGAGPHTKLLFLCSPNNPTGNLLDRAKIDELIKKFEGVVVIDEAYVDFSGKDSDAPKVKDHPNLVVLQTMSKSFGLAGIRLGIAFASEPVIKYFMKVKAPYNVNRLTSQAALDALDHIDLIHENIESIKKERLRLRKKLKKLSVVQYIHASEANFLLVQMRRAKDVYQQLIDQDIIVRYRGNQPCCKNCLRITVGTREENDELLEAINAISSKN